MKNLFATHEYCFNSKKLAILITVILSIQTLKGQEFTIAFYSGRTGNQEIFSMDANGQNLKQLTNNQANDNVPAISPDGEKIVFMSNRFGNSEIMIMDNDGSNLQRLTNTADNEEHPEWSFDGSKIYYILDFINRTEIWVMNANGTGARKLTSNNWRDERPRISPDGSTILFMSNRDGNYEIYTMDADARNTRRITNSAAQEVFPTWSNDGQKIAYSQHRILNGRSEADIHVMSADGSNDRVLTSATGRDENAAWSPDDRYILFQSERNGNFEVYRMKSDGTEQMRLTTNPAWDGWASPGPVNASGIHIEPCVFNMEFYPNPAKDFIIVRSNVGDPDLIEIYSFSGQCIFRLTKPESEHVITLNNWQQGPYLIRVSKDKMLMKGILIIGQ